MISEVAAPETMTEEDYTLRICVGTPSILTGAEFTPESLQEIITQVESILDEQTTEDGEKLTNREDRVEAICGSLLAITEKMSKRRPRNMKMLTMDAMAQAVWLVTTGDEFADHRPPGVFVYCDEDHESADGVRVVKIVAYGDTESFEDVVAAMREAGAQYGVDRRRFYH